MVNKSFSLLINKFQRYYNPRLNYQKWTKVSLRQLITCTCTNSEQTYVVRGVDVAIQLAALTRTQSSWNEEFRFRWSRMVDCSITSQKFAHNSRNRKSAPSARAVLYLMVDSRSSFIPCCTRRNFAKLRAEMVYAAITTFTARKHTWGQKFEALSRYMGRIRRDTMKSKTD